ncbi:polysaccharide deacetylase [Tomitella fengzijianii]|uniref:Polysaccharide deacetylase n=1 Tax=Tomitella fengzijianii TaxID=2597660 RepID=A0A516X0B0_9ACTN|nr:polysaccharide deacetylase [Tomitella fengzijianii]QDQ96460.1 polysaccharide deacetylase [Tomitella fengzijianii]
MRRRPGGTEYVAIAAVVFVVTALIGVLEWQSTGNSNAAGAGDLQHPANAAEPAEVPALPAPPPSNVPMTRLAPGEKPPQFVLFSFDGVGVTPNWDMFLDAARASGARFTALMTGLYFLTDDNAFHYQGPGHDPGEAAVAFGGTPGEVLEQVRYLNETWLGGHEMGTHYVGHFCAGGGYNGDRWNTADWNVELDEFFTLMANWKPNNGLEGAPEELLFGPEEVRGGRTQCLEGRIDELIPAWKAHGMTWDSSMPSPSTGISWPYEVEGVWEFPIPNVYSPPLGKTQTALDYNFWYTFNRARDEPGTAPEVRRIVKDTYMYMYDQARGGNRAPLVIANHFNQWNGNAFNPATADFMREVCDDGGTICATYSDVVEWMEMQDPSVLAHWQEMPPVATGPHT